MSIIKIDRSELLGEITGVACESRMKYDVLSAVGTVAGTYS